MLTKSISGCRMDSDVVPHDFICQKLKKSQEAESLLSLYTAVVWPLFCLVFLLLGFNAVGEIVTGLF